MLHQAVQHVMQSVMSFFATHNGCRWWLLAGLLCCSVAMTVISPVSYGR